MKTSAHTHSSSAWYWYVGYACVLISVTMGVYWPSRHYPFQFDDLANISRHFNIRHYSLKSLFFSGTRWISYWLNSLHYYIAKFDPYIYRTSNITIHCINGVLIFGILAYLLRRCTRHPFFAHHAVGIAWVTAALFLLHPVQTQTVSYVIQGQLEGLATMSTLIMVALFIAWTHTTELLGMLSTLGALFAVAILSCGTKEVAIIAPLLIMLIDWFFIAHGSWQSFKKNLPVHALLTISVLGMYVYLLQPSFFLKIFGLQYVVKNNIGNVITSNPEETIYPLIFFLSQFKVICHYLWMFIWPFNICVEYDWKLVAHPFALDCIAPLALLVVLTGITVRLIWHYGAHPIAWGALWFALALAPRSSIMPSPELIVDYKTYLPSVGWLFILASGLVAAFVWCAQYLKKQQWFFYGAHAAGMVIIIPLAISTIQRNFVWRSGLEFWGNILAMAPGKARAHNNYGVELSQNLGKFSEAIPYFKRAIAMDPKYPDPCNNLAVAYAHLGLLDEAIEALKAGLQINPLYPEGYNNLASFFLQKREFDKAKAMLTNALRLRPYYGKAFFNLGRVHLEEGNTQEAYNCFKQCCTKADLDNEIGFAAYGKLALMNEKFDEALFAYRKLLELDPRNQEGMIGIAAAYLSLKQYPEAIQAYIQLVSLYPENAAARFGLGESYFQSNQFNEALSQFIHIKDKVSGMMLPNMYLRIASCYEHLGLPQQAKNMLVELLSRNSDQEIQKRIQETVTALSQRYQLV